MDREGIQLDLSEPRYQILVLWVFGLAVIWMYTIGGAEFRVVIFDPITIVIDLIIGFHLILFSIYILAKGRKRE